MANTKWQNATITNNFMFRLVMEQEEFCKGVIERVLGIKIAKLTYADCEKSLEVKLGSKGVRLDVYVEDDRGTAYDIEMQASSDNSADLGKRTRYYQSLMDADALKKGEYYGCLRKSIVIFICTFDPFGDSLGRYTFQSVCQENGRVLNDGSTKVFINVKGSRSNLSSDLVLLMDYISSGKAQDGFTEQMEQKVDNLRNDNGTEERYMLWEQQVMEWERRGEARGRAAGYNAGILEGRTTGFADGRNIGYNDGMVDVARNMRKDGKPDSEIIRYTGLSLSALENL